MKNEDIQVYQDRLHMLRDRLRCDVSAMTDAALRQSGAGGAAAASMPIHMAELGSENFDQEFTLSLLETEEGTLAQIDDALKRIEEGVYGKCLQCGGRIPKARLNVLPYTGVCAKCAGAKKAS